MKTELNKHTRYILGLPCVVCGKFAVDLRTAGIEIPHRAEEEQAAVILFSLNLYETYGDDWKNHFKKFPKEMRRLRNEIAATSDKTELNEHTKWILGLINFRCFQFAPGIRALGHPVSWESREEQAEVIHFLLNVYEKYGATWREAFRKLLKQLS